LKALSPSSIVPQEHLFAFLPSKRFGLSAPEPGEEEILKTFFGCPWPILFLTMQGCILQWLQPYLVHFVSFFEVDG
jgi:hypothetical protein